MVVGGGATANDTGRSIARSVLPTPPASRTSTDDPQPLWTGGIPPFANRFGTCDPKCLPCFVIAQTDVPGWAEPAAESQKMSEVAADCHGERREDDQRERGSRVGLQTPLRGGDLGRQL